MKCVGIIPARYGSTRFPGKVLYDICGMSMVEHVYQRAIKWKGFDSVYVATDHVGVKKVCDLKQIPVIMTSQLHVDCIDRVAEVLYQFENKKVEYDRYIIIQGDEPMFNPQMLDVDLSPPIVNFFTAASSDMDDPNAVKVVVSKGNRALYFSRFSLPYSEVLTRKSNLTPRIVYKQLGTYSFSPEMLKIYSTLKPSPLENAEGIGLNRLIENDIPIIMRHSNYDSVSVDTPEDLARVRELIKNQPVLDGRN